MGVLVFDVGTSRIKCALFRKDLSQVSYRSIDNRRVDGDGSVDLELLFDDILAIGSEVVTACPKTESVEAIGVTAIHGHVYLDGDRAPLGPGSAYNDRGARDSCDPVAELWREAGITTTRPIAPDLLAPRLFQMARDDRSRWNTLSTVFGIKDYLLMRLTGALTTDINHADYSLLYDVSGNVVAPAVHLLGLSATPLPEARYPHDTAGVLLPNVREQLGLSDSNNSEITVAIGSSDGTAAMYGGGILTPGSIVVATGTTDVAMMQVTSDAASARGIREATSHGLSLNRSALPGNLFLGGSTAASGGAFHWLAGLLRDDAVINWETAGPGANGILCFPGIEGERAPYADPDARGAFWGLTHEHTGDHLLRALVEGTSFRLADLVSLIAQLGPGPARAFFGGGADSYELQAIRSAVIETECFLLEEQELSLVGTAMFALAGGSTDLLKALSARISGKTTQIVPTPEYRKAYRKLYDQWRALSPYTFSPGRTQL